MKRKKQLNYSENVKLGKRVNKMRYNNIETVQTNGSSLSSQLENRNSNLQGISFSVQLPVFQQYKHIDLNRTRSYQRICLQNCKINNGKSKPSEKFSPFFYSLHKHYSLNMKPKTIIRHCSVQPFQRFQNDSTSQDRNWKQQIEDYMKVKKQRINKQGQTNGFSFMKLSRKNQLIRKIKSNERMESDKPQFIKSLEKNERPQKSLNQNKKILPKIVRLKHLKNNTTIPANKKQEQISNPKKSYFKQAILNANKSQKILINFIGNYFKQKFSPEKRYSDQRTLTQIQQQCFQLKIRNFF